MSISETKHDKNPTGLQPLAPGMSVELSLQTLRMNALLTHQKSVGAGDQLVQILKDTIKQMETTHRRVQNMSTILFGAGLVMLGFGLLFVFRGQEAWGTLISGTGGIASLAATFWTAPLEKMSRSVRDLVKLETVFLGYIRGIGALDSAFQMQYLNILANESNVTLDGVSNENVSLLKDMMDHALKMIDEHLGDEGDSKGLKQQLDALNKRLEAVEKAQKS